MKISSGFLYVLTMYSSCFFVHFGQAKAEDTVKDTQLQHFNALASPGPPRHFLGAFRPLAAQSTGKQQSQQPSASAQGSIVIYLVDRSASVGGLPVPDPSLAMITHHIRVAELARAPTKFLVVTYSGQGVQVFGDAKGMPTLAYETLLAQLDKEFPKPNGTTPLVEAYEKLASILTNFPVSERITIIHSGDGIPTIGFDKNKYPKIAAYMSKRISQATQGVAPDEQQEKIDVLQREWNDPLSPEGKRLWALYEKEATLTCHRIASHLKKPNLRFVSVDFNGVQQLRDLHEASGGAVEDYLLVKPASKLIQSLHDRGLTQYSGVLLSPPLRVESLGKSRHIQRIPLSSLSDATVITVVFEKPIANYEKSIQIAVKVDGQVLKFSADNSDPQTRLCRDNAGRLAAAIFSMPSPIKSHEMAFAFRLHSSAGKIPPLVIYRHQRLSDSFDLILRPLNSQPTDPAPYRISPNQPVTWQAYVTNRITKEILPVAGIDVFLENQAQTASRRLAMVADPQTPGLFITSEPILLARGKYDAVVSFMVAGSTKPSQIRLTEQIDCRAVDEYLTLEVDDSSASFGYIDWGEIGDATVTKSVKCFLRSHGVNYPIQIRLTAQDFVDSESMLISADLVSFSRPELTIKPGQRTPISVTLKIPSHLEDVADGLVEGRLVAVRTDLNESIDILTQQTDDSSDILPDTIQFFLRRPTIQLSASRAGHNELRVRGKAKTWPIPIDIAKPFVRSLALKVSHDSELEREITVKILGPFRNKQGRTYLSAKLIPTHASEAVRLISPCASQQWIYDLQIPEELPNESVRAFLEISGPGLRTERLLLEINPRKPLLGPYLRKAFFLLATLAGFASVVALTKAIRLRRFRKGNTFLIRTDRPFKFLGVERGRLDEILLRISQAGILCRFQKETRNRTVRTRLPLKPDEVSPENPLIITQPQEEDALSIAIEEVRTDPNGPVLMARIEDPGQDGLRRHQQLKRSHRRILIFVIMAGLAQCIYYPSVIAALQWCGEALRLL